MNNLIHNYNDMPKIKNTIKNSNKIKNKNIRSYSQDYNIILNNYYAKPNINYIAKNK